MAHFWKWLIASLVCAIVFYAGLIGLSACAIPWRAQHFDSVVATTTEQGWANEARYFMLNKYRFSEPANRVVVIGASTARDPFRPEIMEKYLPGWSVANASLSGAGMGEIADAVDLYYDEHEHAAGATIFVFCLTYLQFRPTVLSPGQDTPLATEAGRGGLFARSGGTLRPTYPRFVERLEEAAFHPQAVAASLPHRLFKDVFENPILPPLKNFADRFRGKDPLSRWTQVIGDHPDLNAIEVPPDMRRALLAQRLNDGGGDRPSPPAQYSKLVSAIAQIRGHGDAAVVVDLPLPPWHLAGVSNSDKAYETELATIVRSFNNPHVAEFSLRDLDADDNFFDSGHTKPRLWPNMSVRVARYLAANFHLPAAKASAPSPSQSQITISQNALPVGR